MLLWVLLFFLISRICLSTSQYKSLYTKVYAKYPGDIYIAGIFSMNQKGNDSNCRDLIEQDGLQALAAAMYGIELVTNMKILPFRLGLLAIDTCQDKNYIIEQSREFLQFQMKNIEISYICSNGDVPQLKDELKSFQRVIGVFGAANSDVSATVAMYLKIIRLPQLSYFSTSPILSDEQNFPTFFRTIPSDEYVSKAIIELLKYYDWNNLIILSDDSDYSKQTTHSFTTQFNNETNRKLCIIKNIKIEKMDRLENYINQILTIVNETESARVILTLLNQPVAEAFIEYVDRNPNKPLGQLLWIATDSWGGRKWKALKPNNSILNNTIAVIPRAYNNSDFMSYYKSRLPSIIDSDPWLAYKFEEVCRCQYQNFSKFIVRELDKIEKRSNGSLSCETNETECAKIVYSDWEQMLYIHYVIDGILAYAYTLKELAAEVCNNTSSERCINSMYEKGLLDVNTFVKRLRNISFKDSTGQTFRFFRKDGEPKYSFLLYEKSKNMWSIIGNISVSDKVELHIEDSFKNYMIETFKFPQCPQPRWENQSRSTFTKCCWEFAECAENEIIDNITNPEPNHPRPNDSQKCTLCGKNKKANNLYNECIIFIEELCISFDDGIAVSIIIINILGLLGTLISCVVMVLYWKTPIIKAFGRETSIIILLGTMLSFILSISLLEKPKLVHCYLRCCSPGFCSTLCYAAILAKTNRIARIFGFKLSSKKNNTPRFISPLSQVNIVIIITAIEFALLSAVMFTSSMTPNSTDHNVFDCPEIMISSLLSIFLIPIFLLLSSTIYAYKIRKTPDGFNETRNLNFLNFANCVVLITCLLLYQILRKNQYSVIPFCLLLTLGAHSNLLGLFYPKIYIILFRPSKNTTQAISMKTRSKSQSSLSPSPLEFFATDSKNQNSKTITCHKCQHSIISNIPLDVLSKDYVDNEKLRSKSNSKVNFLSTPNNKGKNEIHSHYTNRKTENERDNATFIHELL